MLLDHLRSKPSLLIAGVMSGTSLDGIDVAFVEISGREGGIDYMVRGLYDSSYSVELREQLLRASVGELSNRDVAHLDVELGERYTRAIQEGIEANDIAPDRLDAVGLHGQTIYHNPSAGITQQIGSAAVIAEGTSSIVISDFRTADVAAGGEGAPLVPFCDAMLLHDPGLNRVALNIGGMANLTWLPSDLDPDSLLAFDTGPGNVLMDGAMRELRGEECDRDGKVAAEGDVDEDLVNAILDDPWFALPPPKSTGRERFGDERGREIARNAKEQGRSDGTILRSLAAVTARSIADGLRSHVTPLQNIDQIVVSGGGANNPVLMELLREYTAGADVMTSDRCGIPPDAKEAICFAILAWATLNGIPSNVPSVTGARGKRILGTIRRKG